MTGGIGGLCGWASPPPPSLTPPPPAEHPPRAQLCLWSLPAACWQVGVGLGGCSWAPRGPCPHPGCPVAAVGCPGMRCVSWPGGGGAALFGIRAFAHVMHVRCSRRGRAGGGARRQESDRAAGRTEKEAHRRVEEKPREGRQRWQRCVTSRGAPGATSSWQRQEGASLRASRRSQPCRHPGFGVQNREGIGIWHFQLKSVLVC